jgi:hypothetical protein
MTAVASAKDGIPELLDAVVVVNWELWRGENARNSLATLGGPGENSLDRRSRAREFRVPLVMVDPSWVSSGVDGFGGLGPLARE